MTEPRWLEIKDWAETELKRCAAALESPQPELSTNLLRGEVKMLRALLARALPHPGRDESKAIQRMTDPLTGADSYFP